MAAVTAGSIQATTAMPLTRLARERGTCLSSRATTSPTITDPKADPAMNTPVRMAECQNAPSALSLLRLAVPVKLKCAAVGPMSSALVNAR